MNLLALDTSSLACSVGVSRAGNRFLKYAEKSREHTRILLPMISAALADAALEVTDLDAVVLGNGPGSFIGMRIAASVAQGLAHGASVPIVPVSSLAAVALAVGKPGEVVAVAQDAHVDEVYLGLYRIDADGAAVALGDERLHGQGPIDELDDVDYAVAAGFGWQRYPALAESNHERLARVDATCLYPRPEALLELGARSLAARPGIDPADLKPAYLRKKVAEKPSR